MLQVGQALLPDGWARDVLLCLDDDGKIIDVMPECETVPAEAEYVDGCLLPGIGNCHSHAFQRLLAGVLEHRSTAAGDFWEWRDGMYRLQADIEPDILHAVAAQLYVEMLKAGYTGVAEFHYLHHQSNGEPYGEPAEMSMHLLAAAQQAGIRLTLLPVLYAHSGFDGQPAEPGQRRFVHDVESFTRLLETLQRLVAMQKNCTLGVAFHSLRAVTEGQIQETLDNCASLQLHGPLHIHIAEQQREVDDCRAWSGQRPVEWLLARFAINRRWCLVHATHLGAAEIRQLASSGAVAGLCPSTEANLGDGLFAALPYVAAGGSFAIGSDSQVAVDPVQELRLLEYGQRLVLRRRGILADESWPATGEFLFRHAVAGGAGALGVQGGDIAVDHCGDFIVLDPNDPVLAGRDGPDLLNSWIFASQRPAVRDVMVAGHWRVRDGRHPEEEDILARFMDVQARLGGVR